MQGKPNNSHNGTNEARPSFVRPVKARPPAKPRTTADPGPENAHGANSSADIAIERGRAARVIWWQNGAGIG